MKKLLGLFLFLLVLSSCASKKITYNYSVLLNNVEKVELLYYIDNTNFTIENFIDEKMELESFLLEFSNLELTKTYGAPGSLYDYCIKLYYNNGTSELITKNHWETFDNSNERTAMSRIECDEELFNDLVEQFKD